MSIGKNWQKIRANPIFTEYQILKSNFFAHIFSWDLIKAAYK